MSTNTPPHDEVAARLQDLERQGGSLSRLAHWCAAALLMAFSLGSLISLSYSALLKFLAFWQRGILDVPDAISIAVSLLLVVGMDVAMLYAASHLRVLSAAGAPAEERRYHQLIMITASVLESATYAYMLWQFDRPENLWLWAIGIGRALAAPVFATYLSMARPLPVAPRDIAYYTSLFSGQGVVYDVAHLSADRSAPLERKVKIYRASALMSDADRARFDAVVEAVRLPEPQDMAQEPQPPTTPPEPPEKPPVRTDGTAPPAVLRLPSPRTRRSQRARGAHTRGVRTVEAKVREVWRSGMSVGQLERAAHISRSSAHKYRRILEAEQHREIAEG